MSKIYKNVSCINGVAAISQKKENVHAAVCQNSATDHNCCKLKSRSLYGRKNQRPFVKSSICFYILIHILNFCNTSKKVRKLAFVGNTSLSVRTHRLALSIKIGKGKSSKRHYISNKLHMLKLFLSCLLFMSLVLSPTLPFRIPRLALPIEIGSEEGSQSRQMSLREQNIVKTWQSTTS